MSDRIDMREEALDTLLLAEKENRSPEVLIQDTLIRLEFLPRQHRAFYRRLCEGVTERRIYLDFVLDFFSKTPMRRCKPFIRTLLRLGAYQILFMEVRDAAACNEAVALAKKRGFRNLSGFVNGVLRTVSRQKDHLPLPDRTKEPVRYLSVRYAMEPWIVKLLCTQYGFSDAERMLASFLDARPLTIRTNCSKIAPDVLARRLQEEGLDVTAGVLFPYAFSIDGFNVLLKVPSFRQGLFAVQDEASMLPGQIARIRAGATVLDLCAAPGGKALHMADRLKGEGLVIARDIREEKTDRIRENAQRAGFENICVQEADARVPDPSLFGKADVVVADLPCSGLGIIGRKNEIRQNRKPEDLPALRDLQREILSVAWRYVAPGGQLIFSTCTVNRAENEENAGWISENTPLRPSSIEEALPERLRGRTGKDGYLTVLPGIDPCDGFFVSSFIRQEEA